MTIPLSLLALHFIGDFLLQTDWMALNKSKQWDVLAIHAAVYSVCFFWFGSLFVLMTFVTHFITDAITSRITSRLWFVHEVPNGFYDYDAGNKRHWFFVMIGFDQLIHFVTLAATYSWIH